MQILKFKRISQNAILLKKQFHCEALNLSTLMIQEGGKSPCAPLSRLWAFSLAVNGELTGDVQRLHAAPLTHNNYCLTSSGDLLKGLSEVCGPHVSHLHTAASQRAPYLLSPQ